MKPGRGVQDIAVVGLEVFVMIMMSRMRPVLNGWLEKGFSKYIAGFRARFSDCKSVA